MKTDEEIRLEIASLFFRPGGRPQWEDVAGDAEKMYVWVKQGTPSGPAPAQVAAPTPGDTGDPGPGVTPGQAAQRNQTSRNNPTGRA